MRSYQKIVSRYLFSLLGAKPHVVQAGKHHLTKTYSAVSIAGIQDGYFKQEDEENIISRIQEAKPDLLLVALGFPRQENFYPKQ